VKDLETEQNRNHVFSAVVLTVVITLSLFCIASVYRLTEQMSMLQSEVATLQSTTETSIITQESNIITTSNIESVSLSDLYEVVKNSVVTIECTLLEHRMPFGQQITSEVQGSGFVYEYDGQMIIITYNHVVEDADSITVTFVDKNTYDTEIIGTDFYTDLAVLCVEAPESDYYPLEIVSSSMVSVGDYVVAIGSPYGLAGTMTTGIVSALDRTITITEGMGGSYDMIDLIQTSAPINSGNSGGPLMTYNGQVIGITTAIVSNSDGLGFAVPSDTILSVVETLFE
jgi:S1-C subfamily serine protease